MDQGPENIPLAGRSGCQGGRQLSASAAERGPRHGETRLGSSWVDIPALLCTAGMGGRRDEGQETFV